MESTKLGILASRTLLPHLTQKVIDTFLVISDQNIVLMGGWHSPMEVEIHKQLVRNRKPHIHVGAKSVHKLSCKLAQDKVLFMTHCRSTINRITRENALQRNRILCERSDILLIPWLDPNGKTHKIASEFCKKKPVYIFDSEYNAKLLQSGAQLIDNLTISSLTGPNRPLRLNRL